MHEITCIAPVNIAVIKYWGKRDEKLILPLNDSVSVTLNVKEMNAKTTVMADPSFKNDRIWLNGKEESIENPRLQNCLRELRRKAGDNAVSKWHVHICSENNFPTAAGLASSAAGYACLVYSLAQLYGIKENLSAVARQGSGSACRSLQGGFVRWHKGSNESGSDSIATQIAPASHWSGLRILILVVNDTKKKLSSTTGMQRSVETSELMKHRVVNVVPGRTEAMVKAILDRNFHVFAELTMKESNQFHAVCLDTYPPAVYMNDTSHLIADIVHLYNKYHGQNKVAYTFDAGPNACLYMLESEVQEVATLFTYIFPPATGDAEFIKGIPIERSSPTKELLSAIGVDPETPGLLKYIIHTSVGEGPQVLKDPNTHLLAEDGLPKNQISLVDFQNISTPPTI